ncbi:MAG: hypothetical protein ABI772_08310 [Bacteroidota bacterium]
MKYKILIAIIVVLPFISTAQHSLLLKTGERMNGEVVALKDGTLSFNFKGNTMNIKLTEVQSIQFSEGNSQAVKTGTDSPVNSGTKGVSYTMNGRKLNKQPVISNLTMEKGIVVVEITINKYGNVIKAEPGAEGTTTTSQYLLTKAKQAAESVAFDTSPTTPLEQKGTITIIF